MKRFKSKFQNNLSHILARIVLKSFEYFSYGDIGTNYHVKKNHLPYFICNKLVFDVLHEVHVKWNIFENLKKIIVALRIS